MYSKELVKGTLKAIILNLLHKHGRMYGYEIYSEVKQSTEGKIILKDGSLYPALKKLTTNKLVTAETETVNGRLRKYYKLTPEGVVKKDEYLAEIKDFISSISKVLSPEIA